MVPMGASARIMGMMVIARLPRGQEVLVAARDLAWAAEGFSCLSLSTSACARSSTFSRLARAISASTRVFDALCEAR
jgi:hypothetical protein